MKLFKFKESRSWLILSGVIMTLSLWIAIFFGISIGLAFLLATFFTKTAIEIYLSEKGFRDKPSKKYQSFTTITIALISIVAFSFSLVGTLTIANCGSSIEDAMGAAYLSLIGIAVYFMLVYMVLPSIILRKVSYINPLPSGIMMLLGHLALTYSMAFGDNGVLLWIVTIIPFFITPFQYFSSFKKNIVHPVRFSQASLLIFGLIILYGILQFFIINLALDPTHNGICM